MDAPEPPEIAGFRVAVDPGLPENIIVVRDGDGRLLDAVNIVTGRSLRRHILPRCWLDEDLILHIAPEKE